MSKLKPVRPKIEINDQFRRALDTIENSDRHVFITGRAGTGKSTLLEYFRSFTGKKVVVLAPTGVAALNVKGQTIHSFFKFKPHVTLDQINELHVEDDETTIFKKIDAIIIDEVSMVRADLLDCVDKFLRLNGPNAGKPFGGIQMVFIGDLYQLPPVVTNDEKEIFNSFYETPYFFSANVFNELNVEFIELEKIYRQHNQAFINLLNAIRNNSVDESGLALLNSRYIPGYEPSFKDFYIYLTTTNEMARTINNQQLEKQKGTVHTFTGSIEGEFGNEYLPTLVDLQVKLGAQIMMLNNDQFGRWVNGTIGKIMEITVDESGETIIVAELSDGEKVEIYPFTWQIFRYFAKGRRLQSEVMGTFTQYPLMLAWAVTIHKSQGKTYEKVVIDIGKGTFAHGQTYVALSRCTSLDGIILKKPIRKNNVWMDYRVIKFLTRYQYNLAEKSCSSDEKIDIIKRAIDTESKLKIVYLKPNDEKSERTILPIEVGEMEYSGVTYTGVHAYCFTRKEKRIFRIDRILGIEEL
jgi:ATP-dependent DNA helicase PIF1